MIALLQQVPGVIAGGFSHGYALVALVLGALAFFLWIWMLVDAIRNPRLEGDMRIVWVVVIIFTGVIGALIYAALGRSRG